MMFQTTNKPKVLLVEDCPDIREDFTNPLYSLYTHYFRTYACTSYEFKKIISCEHKIEDPFAVIIHDIYGVDFPRNLELLEQRCKEIGHACKLKNMPEPLIPSILIVSGTTQENIRTIVKELRGKNFWGQIAGMEKPTDPEEEIDVIYHLAKRNYTGPDVIDAAFQLSPPLTLTETLESFRKYKDICKRKTTSDPERQQIEQELYKNFILLDEQALMQLYYCTVAGYEEKTPFTYFPASTGNSIAGRIVFSSEEATTLRATDPESPIILVTNDKDGMACVRILQTQGVIVIGKASIHFAQIVRSKGLSGLFIEDEQMEETGVKVGKDDRGKYLSFGMNVPVSVRTGDWVTIDTNERYLYGRKLDVIPPTLPPLYKEFVEYSKLILTLPDSKHISAIDAPEPIYFSVQADQQESMKTWYEEVGLSRMENFYIQDPGRTALLNSLKDPSGKNLISLKNATTRYVSNLFFSKNTLIRITFRLMDFKPDQFLNAEEEQKLKERYGLSTLRGFTLAHKVPEIYRAQVEGVFDAVSIPSHGRLMLNFAVPHTEHAKDITLARKIIGNNEIVIRNNSTTKDVLPDINGHYIFPKILPVIETKKGVANALDIFKACIADDPYDYVSLPVLIGTNDLTSDIIGINRNNLTGIKKYMEENPHKGHPFLTLFEELGKEIRKICKAAETAQNIRSLGKNNIHIFPVICGEHATYLQNYYDVFPNLGIKNVCVPANPLYYEGLQNAYLFYLAKRVVRSRQLQFMPDPT